MKKRLLFTGATGFLGKNIKPILMESYEVTTLGASDKNDIKVDLAKDVPHISSQYDVVLHAAGKAHYIPKTDSEIKEFYNTNYMGTVNLCSALESHGVPQSFIFISTVAVYGVDSGENITENGPLNGNTPYASSKIMAEQYLSDWCAKHNVILTILRPSLIAGPEAPGNLGAMVKGISSGRYLSIAGGHARKSVLMVQDIARLVMLSADKGGIYNVCDDTQPTFRQLESIIAKQAGVCTPVSIPYWFAKCCALVGDCLGKRAPINSQKLRKITKSLTFSNEKAKRMLNWTPTNVLENYHI